MPHQDLLSRASIVPKTNDTTGVSTSTWTNGEIFIFLWDTYTGYTDWSLSKTFESVGTTVVSLIVGPSKTTFQVDKSLLCGSVDFFSKAFNSEFKEAQTSQMELPDDKAETVRNFLTWLYSGPSMQNLLRVSGISFGEMLELFILAEKLALNELQQELYEKIKDKALSFKEVEICQEYWQLAKDSRIRFVPLVMYARNLRGRSEDLTTLQQTIGNDTDFLQDVALCQIIFQIHRENLWYLLPSSLEEFLKHFGTKGH